MAKCKTLLFFWYTLWAVKQWLAKNKTMLTYYNRKAVTNIFELIDKGFVPQGQL